MRRLIVAALCGGLFISCSSLETYPQRRCLYYGDKRFNTGTVIEKRDDGARLFKFDDRSQGDHGYRWVAEVDAVNLRPCAAASAVPAFDASHAYPSGERP